MSAWYEEFTSRNKGLINQEEQERLKKLRVGIAGCGMGSTIAVSLVRLGVENIILSDPDTVDLSNLNRQDFTYKDVGKNKAQALRERLLQINPELEVEVWERVTLENAISFSKAADIIIDCIDPFTAFPVSFALGKWAEKESKIYLWPADVGFGAIVLVFHPQSEMSFTNIVSEPSLSNVVNYLIKNIPFPPYILKMWKEFQRGIVMNYPQPITTTLMSAAIVTSLIVKIIKEEKLPHLIFIDPFEVSVTVVQ